MFLRVGAHTIYVSKNISISDDVYRRLKREKGDRSFSEIIEAKLASGGNLSDVTGERILAPGTYEAVRDEIDHLSDGTMDRLDDEAP
jgi:predicted CopG family antitoxin